MADGRLSLDDYFNYFQLSHNNVIYSANHVTVLFTIYVIHIYHNYKTFTPVIQLFINHF